MEIFLIILVILLLFILIIAPCIVSGKCSREEEYRTLDPKKLDDEEKWEEDLIYDDEFIKKEGENENE